MNLVEALLHALKQQGARAIFGIPGDFALPMFGVIEASEILPLYTLSHEPGIGFAADGAARAASGIGVVAVTYGAGALNLVNPIAAAFAERSPLVILSGAPGQGQRDTGLMLHHQARTLDSQMQMLSEITCDQARLDDVRRAPSDIARVLGSCRTHSQPVYFEIPRDAVSEPCAGVSVRARDRDDSAAAGICAEEILGRIAAAEAPILMAGVEVRRYDLEAKVAELARKLGLEVVTSFMGQGLLARTELSPLGTYMGSGMGASADSEVASRVESADTLLLLGVIPSDMNLGVSARLLDPRRCIQVYNDRVALDYHVFPDLPIGAVVDAMLSRLGEPAAASAPARTAPRLRLVADQGVISPDDVVAGVNDLIHELGPMPVLADAGDCLFAARQIQGAPLLAPGYYASMGFAVPAGLGVQASTGERPLILVGDGAFQMTGWELGHCRRYGWDPIVVVFNNRGSETLRTLHPEAGFCNTGDWNYAELARGLGGAGVRVNTRAELQAALTEAARTRGQFQLIEAMIPEGLASRMLQQFLEGRKAGQP